MTVTTSAAIASLRHYIDGEWKDGGPELLVSTNPARPHEVVAHGHQASTSDVDQSLIAARAAARSWARTPIHERGAILVRAAEILESSAAAYGLELAREEGKTLAEANGEVFRAAQILRYFGAAGDRAAGELFSSPRRGERILVTHKPLGVVGVVTPFNFPIAIPAWKIAPALVYGNTVVWKPSSLVPLLAVRLTEALVDAGLPSGVLNLVMGDGALGAAIVESPYVDGITFTGSTPVGRQIMVGAAERGAPVQAEMGGKNASLVLADADLDLATEQVLFAAFRSTGQKCTATSRLILDEAIADEFLRRLDARLSTWITGDPTDPAVHMGPVINDAAAEKIRAGIRLSIEQGAVLRAGDGDGSTPPNAAFVPPTVLELPSDQALASSNHAWIEEFFGPVLSVRRVADAAAAFELANDSDLGLSASIFTQDVTRVLDAIDEIEVGILHVNSESAGADPHVPFGGAKKSGYGPKEQGGAARDFFTSTTTVYLRGGDPA